MNRYGIVRVLYSDILYCACAQTVRNNFSKRKWHICIASERDSSHLWHTAMKFELDNLTITGDTKKEGSRRSQ